MPAPSETASPRDGLTSSLLFWPCLVVAAGLYGAVATTPRLLQYVEQHDEYRSNQLRLVELQSQVRHLERVVQAFETDPTFAARLARTEFATAAADEERIPVPPDLSLDGEPVPRAQRPARSRWLLPLIEFIAVDRRLRQSGLVAAALLVLVAFGAQCGPSRPAGEPAARSLGWLRRRYLRHEKPAEPAGSVQAAHR